MSLWDVLAGEAVQQYGRVDFAAKRAELFAPRSVGSWFSCDHRLGQLTVTLEPPGCFAAEEYAQVWVACITHHTPVYMRAHFHRFIGAADD